MRKLSYLNPCHIPSPLASFSPLAGIRYAETGARGRCLISGEEVSVPLRGLDMRKLMKTNMRKPLEKA